MAYERNSVAERMAWQRIDDLNAISQIVNMIVAHLDRKHGQLLIDIKPCTSCGRKVASPCDGYFAEGRWDTFCEDVK